MYTHSLFYLHVHVRVALLLLVISRCACAGTGDGFPLGLGLVVEDKPTEFSCTCSLVQSPGSSQLFNMAPWQCCIRKGCEEPGDMYMYVCVWCTVSLNVYMYVLYRLLTLLLSLESC